MSDAINAVTFFEMDQQYINDEVYRYVELSFKKAYEDFGLVLTSKEIGFPEIRKHQIEIPAMDGVLDLTDRLADDVIYGNRQIKLTFDVIDKNLWQFKLNNLANYIHGKYIGIKFNKFDASFTYYGRGEINPFTSDKNIGKIEVNVDCEPFKINKNNETFYGRYGHSISLTYVVPSITSMTGWIMRPRKVVHSSFVSTVDGVLTLNNITYNVEANVEINIDIQIGSNPFTFEPASSVTNDYQLNFYVFVGYL